MSFLNSITQFGKTAFLATSTLCLSASALAAPSAADVAQIADLKSQIVAIAKANQTHPENVIQTYAALNPLIEKLLAVAPKKTEAEGKSLVVGGWHNLWSSMLYAPTVDLTQNYQVVSPNGYYYNVFRQSIFGQAESTDLLRGSYTDAGDHLDIQFTRNALAANWPKPGTALLPFVEQVEAQQICALDIPGPIGVTGELKDAYVDSDLRIITGGDSLGESALIFVMERADTVLAP